MTGKHAVVTQHVKARRRDECTQATDKVERVQEDRVCAVFPRALESNANAAVGMCFKTLQGEWRSRDVTTQAFEALSVATVHDDGGVDVDAADFGECARTGLLYKAKRADELGGLAARRRTEQLNICGRRAVARREDWLIACEGVGGIANTIEASAMPLEHSEKTRVSPSRDLGDVLCRGCGELAELKLAFFVAHIYSIER